MTSIIDLIYMTPDIGALDTWVIEDELATPPDKVVIEYNLANLEGKAGGMGNSEEVTG